MKTEQEIRDTIKALHGEILQLEREAIESLRKRETVEQGSAALVREWVEAQDAIRDHLKQYPAKSEEQPPEVMQAWAALLDREYAIRQRMRQWVEASKEAA